MEKCKVEASANPMSDEVPFPDLYLAEGPASSWSLLTSPTIRAPSSWSNHLPKSLPPNINTLYGEGVRFQHMNLEKTQNSLYNTYHLIFHISLPLNYLEEIKHRVHEPGWRGRMWWFYFTYCYYCSATQSCLTLCDPMGCSMPGSSILHYLLEFAQIHVHWVGYVIQPTHPLPPPSPSALNLSQHWGLFQWVSSWHQVAKVLELQLQHQSFQWIFRIDFL